MPPTVSIVTPFLNPGEFLREAVESVRRQSLDDWELLLVDDGSTDESTEIARVAAWEDSRRIKYLAHPGHAHCGTAASRNLGLEHACAPKLSFLDADDVWSPRVLVEQAAWLKAYPAADVVVASTTYWHSWQTPPLQPDLTTRPAVEPGIVHPPGALVIVNYPLGRRAAPSMNTLCARRDLLDRIGGFEPTFVGSQRMYEDQAFLTKIYLSGSVVVSPEVWDLYRQHPRSISSTTIAGGHYREVRRLYLEWCRDYLRRLRQDDETVRTALLRCVEALESATSDEDALPPSIEESWPHARLDTEGERRWLDAGPVAVEGVSFSDVLTLLGARLHSLIGGGVKIELLWRSTPQSPEAKTVAVHVLDASGAILHQADYSLREDLLTPSSSTFRDGLVFASSDLVGARAVGVAVCDAGGETIASNSNVGDWQGRRLWLQLPRA